jgi:hypothetical protein
VIVVGVLGESVGALMYVGVPPLIVMPRLKIPGET